MARRDLSGAVDFSYLETYAGGDLELMEEVLGLFRQQADLWGPMLDPDVDGWRDAVHTIKGAALGIGANALAQACERTEDMGTGTLPSVRAHMDAVQMDIAAWLHELALQQLKPGRR